MKIYIDENVPLKIVTRMRVEGYIVDYVTRSVPDYEILESASKEGALLITWDKDFERLVLREGKPTAGVIILGISKRVPFEDQAAIVLNVLRRYKGKLHGTCCFLSESSLDVRRPLK